MVGMRIAMFIYCLAAVLGCGWYLSGVIRSLKLLQSQVVLQAGELQELLATERERYEVWKALDTVQRRERPGYDGPAAVEASYETQQAKATLDQAKSIRQAGEARFDSLKSESRHLTRWFTPLIVLALIHLIGIAGLWPRQTNLRRQ